jgi:signal transduction histidine kinase
MTRRLKATYALVLAVCLFVSIAAAWTPLGARFDNLFYDFLSNLNPPQQREAEAVILGIDEQTLKQMGGQSAIRSILAQAMERLVEAKPSAVAIDLVLADPPANTELAAAFAKIPNLILATDLADGAWESPLPEFRGTRSRIGHVHAAPNEHDNIFRQIPLEKAAQRERHWALAFETFQSVHPDWQLTQTEDALELGTLTIPARQSESRPILIRYLHPPGQFPTVTVYDLLHDPSAAAKLTGKAVFVGITAQTAAPDRHMTPVSNQQTIGPSVTVLFCVTLTVGAGLIFASRSGWPAYALGAALLAAVHIAPFAAFQYNIVFPYAAPLATAWLSLSAAASFQHFVVRKRLTRAEAERAGYQQAIHFVAHEMRTPLTAIQGSSEMMGRYKLSEEKRAEMAKMINSESKRLAQLIQTFLDVERLGAGQMELKREPFQSADLVNICLQRAQPLADRKRISVSADADPNAQLEGDRELMEYAFYNLVTNAIKYSNSDTEVTVTTRLDKGKLRLAVADQGIGMEDKELKNIFKKFYRTKKAESSGEAGTGIGLSIVEQIVAQHGGTMEVSSKPGVGSCFTMILPATALSKENA